MDSEVVELLKQISSKLDRILVAMNRREPANDMALNDVKNSVDKRIKEARDRAQQAMNVKSKQ